MQNYKERVKYLLVNYPDTRSTDNVLLARYAAEFHKNISDYFDFINIVPIKAIFRWRRMLQNKYKYLKADPEVRKNRIMLERKYRKHFTKQI